MPTAASINRVLVVGATGRTGRHIVAAAAARESVSHSSSTIIRVVRPRMIFH
jgi:uncharacterized protein YbjT (DUF2867 family)